MTRNRYMTTSVNILRASLVAAVLLTMGVTVKAQDAAESTGPTIRGNVYGGGNKANVGGDTQVSMTGGTISGDVYGGGRGTLAYDDEGKLTEGGIAATVGSTLVELNKDLIGDAKGCIVMGSIFGCNNLNGTPTGNATVHIYATQNSSKNKISEKTAGTYDVKAVYGGGNLAAYKPNGPAATTTNDDYKNTTQVATVIIDGCGLTSIRQVYGGGNAASTPATSVTVNGTYEIEELFGGGNGKDNVSYDGTHTFPNPGANVGYVAYSTDYDPPASSKEERKEKFGYGTGKASVNIYGGTIHRVFGGSNTKGNVSETAVTMLEDMSSCTFCVDEAYGGGKSAPMDAEAKLLMSCIPGLKAAYGGAEAANIEGDVTLNITNGNFDRVFGGNNKSGRIGGTITVNIEETGCKPVIIGQLYGGGNQAPYTAPFVTDDEGNDTDVRQHGPTLNIKSFTSIGEVYGGGYGEGAVVTGDTYVNINEVVGDKASVDEFMKASVTTVTDPATQTTGTDKVSINTGVTKTFKDGDGDDANTINVDIPLHKKGEIGSIGVVFGGGNAAKVEGNTHVNIGTLSSVDYVTKATGEATARSGMTPVGADIRGNVYGGGNQAEVTGDTHVEIGKEATPTP